MYRFICYAEVYFSKLVKGYMEIYDYTINILFSEIKPGTCFVYGAGYYMKIRVAEYNGYTSVDEYKYRALNLQTGFAENIKEDEKFRLIKTKLMVEVI